MINYFSSLSITKEGRPLFSIIVDCDDWVDFSEFCNDVYKHVPEGERRKATHLICRLPIATSFSHLAISALCADAQTAEIAPGETLLLSIRDAIVRTDSFLNRRFSYLAAHVLYSDKFQIHLSDVLNGQDKGTQLSSDEKTDLIAHFRQVELEKLSDKAIFPPIKNHPYITPSGNEAQKFIRVGNIQRQRAAVHAVFFWLLPHLESVSAFLTDTWSITTIAYNASRLLSRYNGASIARVDMLTEYHTAKETTLDINLDALRRFLRGPVAVGEGEKILFLFSAGSTGRLLQQVRQTLVREGLDYEKVVFVALYRLQQMYDDRYLCDLSHLNFGPAAPSDPTDEMTRPSNASEPVTLVESEPIPERDQTTKPKKGAADALGPQTTVEAQRSMLGVLPHTPGIVIDPETYFPRLVAEIEIEIRDAAVKKDRDFYNNYGQLGVFVVHRSDADRSERHHAIYIDTIKLIDSEIFRIKLKAKISEFARAPDLLVAPEHDAAAKLVELISSELKAKFGTDVPTLRHPNLYVDRFRPKPLDDEVRTTFQRFDANSEILIVDDAFITGTRLYQYSQHLRYDPIAYKGRLRFLVAVARPPAIKDWIQARQLLSWRYHAPDKPKSPENTVDAIEVIALPNWTKKAECPWCLEAQRLKTYKDIVETVPSIFVERSQRLNEAGGLLDNLFVRSFQHNPIQLADASLFTSSRNETTCFAAVAGGLQRLRTDPGGVPLGRYRFPLVSVLKSVEYLKIVYNDSLLRASFLRAAQIDELVYHDVNKERERADYALELIYDQSPEISNLVLELGWQCLVGKIPAELLQMIDDERIAILGVSDEFRYLREVLNRIR